MTNYNYEHFMMDFSLLRTEKEINSLYEKVFKIYKNDAKYMAALTGTLNHLCWYYYDKSQLKDMKFNVKDINSTLCQLYQKLYYKNHYYALENFEGDDWKYYYTTTD